MTSNSDALLDKIDSFNNASHINIKNGSRNTPISNKVSTNNNSSSFNPIEFLNEQYQTESSLISALPSLRSTLKNRIEKLDDSISSTIQKQSDLADLTLSDVSRAKSAILELHHRVTTVQTKARLSETAVQQITRDMKRLDYAKKHLSKTITALKRLHMLIHAVTQLRQCVRHSQPFPDYKNVANLLDATRLLLGHFEGYMKSVDKMRALKEDVELMRHELEEGVVFGFRVVGFGYQGALEKSGDSDQQDRKKTINKKNVIHKPPIKRSAAYDSIDESQDEDTKPQQEASEENNTEDDQPPKPPMPPQVLSTACIALDSIGSNTRASFIKLFCSDHLEPYQKLFNPKHNTSAIGATSSASKPSFKILNPENNEDSKDNIISSNPSPASLDQVERRYAWFRRTLKEQIEEKFPSVFPHYWNMHYHITFTFLTVTGQHFLMLLSNSSGKNIAGTSSKKDKQQNLLRDRDCENVTILLKALQKTILFEKEMTAWLQREYNVVFLDSEERKDNKDGGSPEEPRSSSAKMVEDSEKLEFDENGKAVVASSAEGIRIKYERQMKDRKMRENGLKENALGGLEDLQIIEAEREKDGHATSVLPLIGVASTAFDKYMGPYISLEEKNMDELLVESASDKAVDTRGELPVFTSSTALFVYIKNSITRCTVLTRGKTLFLLYRAFQDTLRKYSLVLAGKFPPPLSGAAAAAAAVISGINISLTGGGSSSANAIYRVPVGEETTICHVIDTCEYCADTVEALQDLIADKIEDKYKSKIDMGGEQEAFHEVTAKGIRVLVSGLEQRTELAFKAMSSINWGSLNVVGEESSYVRSMHSAIQPFVVTVKRLLPNSYFRNFCDKFAITFTTAFYSTITRCKRISESGTQQLLLDVYNLKTLLLKMPVLASKTSSSKGTLSTIAPAMYTKMVTKEFQRIETLLKLVGTPGELLIDVFRVQWSGGSALALQTVMNLKGMKRNEQAAMLEKFGVDPMTAMKGAAVGAASTTMTENIQALQDRSSDVAAKVNSDLYQMRQKVEDFRKTFR